MQVLNYPPELLSLATGAQSKWAPQGAALTFVGDMVVTLSMLACFFVGKDTTFPQTNQAICGKVVKFSVF